MVAESAVGGGAGIAREAGWFLTGALVVCGGFSLFLAGMRGVPCLDALWQTVAGIIVGALMLVPVVFALGCGGRLVRTFLRRRRMFPRKPVIAEGGVWLHPPTA